MLRSHKNPDKDLFEHLDDVYHGMKNIFDGLCFDNRFLTKEKIENYLKIIAYCHDIGKATSFFQNKLETEKDSILSRHSKIGAVFSFYISSLLILPESEIFIIYRLIYCHHSSSHKNTSDLILTDDDKKNIKIQINDIISNNESKIFLDKVLKKFEINEFIIDNFNNFIDSINKKIISYNVKLDIKTSFNEKDEHQLILYFILYASFAKADKYNALFRESYNNDYENRNKLAQLVSDSIVDIYKKIEKEKYPEKYKDTELNQLRELFYQDIQKSINKIELDDKKIFQVMAPTGMGKTLTIFNAAVQLRNRLLRKKNLNYRIIYSLPFLSIIDQTSTIIQEILKENKLEPTTDLFLEYHYLANTVERQSSDEEIFYDNYESLMLNNFWESEIILTTFVSFIELFASGENLIKFTNIANSIIILDEIQSIDAGLYKYINWFLNILTRYFNCYIFLTTATMPKIFKDEQYQNLYYSSDLQNLLYLKSNRYVIHYLRDMLINNFIEHLKEYIRQHPDESILVVSNTKKMAYQISNNLNMFDFKSDLIHLTTATIPILRKILIEKIKDKKLKNRKIIISTQLIEAGVDISVNTIFKFLSPFESIIQAAGRANRNYELGEKGGKIFLINVLNEKNISSYEPVYIRNTKRTGGDMKMNNTKNIITNEIEEKAIFDFCKKYFYDLTLGNYWNEIELDLMKQSLKDFGEKIQVINDEVGKYTVFIDIEIDVNGNIIKSINTYKKYLTIKRMEIKNKEDIYKRKMELKKLQSEFSKYCVSISSYDLEYLAQMGFINKNEFIKEKSIPLLPKESYDILLGLRMYEDFNQFM